jgi:hypothetical protein
MLFERKSIAVGEKVPLRLTSRHREALLDNTGLPTRLTDRLRIGLKEGNELIFQFTLPELAELGQAIAAEADIHSDPDIVAQLDEIYGRIVWLLDTHVESDRPGQAVDEEAVLQAEESLAEMPEVLREGVLAILQDPEVQSLEEVERRINALADEFNRQGMLELGGLSPMHVRDLLVGAWEGPDAVVQLNEELPDDDVEEAEFLVNARVLLQEVRDAGKVRATTAGNLNRRFVDHMLDRLRLPSGYTEEVREYRKVINEQDVDRLHEPRVVLELAGLLAHEGNNFELSADAESYIVPGKAGALYALLFRTFFRGFNLAYSDWLPDAPGLQEGIPFSLYVIAKDADDWQGAKELAPRLFLPFVKAEIPPIGDQDYYFGYANLRILRHLEKFHLIERRFDRGKYHESTNVEIRKTPLFDRFIRFRFSDTEE